MNFGTIADKIIILLLFGVLIVLAAMQLNDSMRVKMLWVDAEVFYTNGESKYYDDCALNLMEEDIKLCIRNKKMVIEYIDLTDENVESFAVYNRDNK